MSSRTSFLTQVAGLPVTPVQQQYLDGFFAGVAARGLSFGDVSADPVSAPDVVEDEDPTVEEAIKKALHPLDFYPNILIYAATNTAPEKEDIFRYKWSGLFYLSPIKGAFMARLRIPGGVLKSWQLREIAHTAKDLTTGYCQITTRSNLQVRLIEPRDAPEFLRRIQGVGLHTKGSGADNIRNLTIGPAAGFDPHELIDTLPLIQKLGHYILSTPGFYDLPRKFNIAIDGAGVIGSLEDTNDIGLRAVNIGPNSEGVAPGIWFRLALGGATGLKSFAEDCGVLIAPEQAVEVCAALVRIFIKHGNRSDRKRARLKYLLEKMPLPDYLDATEQLLGWKLARATPAVELPHPVPAMPHAHIGDYPQIQTGLRYLGVHVPVGELTPDQMLSVADLADEYGQGEIRLTVWENFLLPHVPEARIPALKAAMDALGFPSRQTNVRTGFVACTGSTYCKFAAANTKGSAIALMDYLDSTLTLPEPVNVHVTGCPHSCAQHYIGDIGLLGARNAAGAESFHVFVGGGFGKLKALGRQVFQALTLDELKPVLTGLLRSWTNNRQENESFQAFTARHTPEELKTLAD